MVNTYSYNAQRTKALSAHFQVGEFASFGNGRLYSDTILIDSNLVVYLETLFNKLRASKCIISSGYRTSACDRIVGGSGVGQHVNGRAADCCYYDKQGRPIPATVVVCAAWDLGQFTGIARIDANYVHLDTRTSGTYRGDETRGNSSYWTNPYTYFGVSKETVAKYTGEVAKTLRYQSHGVGKKRWYTNVNTNTDDYAGVFGVPMDGLYIDDLKYKVKLTGYNRWLPEVTGRRDYAGILDKPITDVAIQGATYRVHVKGGNWLGWVNGYNTEDYYNGYAGNGKIIDAIQIKRG